MPRLFQLANGTWIDPEYILAVEAARAIPPSEFSKVRHAPRVIIHLQGNDRRVIDCESEEDAETLRDEIAAKVP